MDTSGGLDFGMMVPMLAGPDDGGIHRGDRTGTGDNKAQPTEKGSGPAQATVDDSAFGGTSSIRHSDESAGFDVEQEREDQDGLEVVLPDDGRLGLTNYGDKPPEDWAADTGETKTSE